VRRANRAILIRHLLPGEAVSRQELADLTGLSAGTVTNVVAHLLDEGLVIEAGSEDSDGGRPRILLRLARDRATVFGVEVGETRLRVEAFDLGLDKLGDDERLEVDAPRSPEAVVAAIVDAVGTILARPAFQLTPIAGLGVGVSGIVDDTERLVYATSIDWHGVPLETMLTDRLRIPVRVDNGAKTLGQAEMWLGAGRGARHAAIALLGTGVGAAVFADGRLYRGAHSSAGEWGHTTVTVGGKSCRCGARGCLEAYVGGWALARQWRSVEAEPDEEVAIERLAQAVGRDDRANEILDDFVEYLGAGLANLVNLFNPERIVLSGWVGLALGQATLDRVRARTHAYALSRPYEQVEIVLGQLGADAVALGAATLVIDGIVAGELPLPERALNAASSAEARTA
jgi:predicted NBD/HSP70 family sugar kinase